MEHDDDFGDTAGKHLLRFLEVIQGGASSATGIQHEVDPRAPTHLPRGTAPARGDTLAETVRVGTVIRDTWELTGLLGQGGFGLVFSARHRSLQREDAIKFLHPHLVDDKDLRERFRREAIVMAKLRGSHLVQVHDCGEHQGLPFFVMERLEGTTLDALLERGGALPLPTFRQIAGGILRGIAQVHSHGIVHRDVKPANIFVSKDVEGVKLLDFGLAMTSMRLTSRGGMIGTPLYMAPELLTLAEAEASVATDIYSAGVVLYQMLTGHLPMAPGRGGNLADLVHRVATGHPIPPSDVRPGLPPELDAVLLRALNRQPRKRPETVEALAEALESLPWPEGDALEYRSSPPRLSVSARLEAAYSRREGLMIAGEDTTEVEEKILELRREQRHGPTLHEGDFLCDGRFRLIEEIGQGGFGTVWKAYDREGRRLVAVKVLHGQFAQSSIRRERLFRGARRMAGLRHPHITHVIVPEGHEQGFYYYVMEYAAGGDLHAAIVEGRIQTERALSLIESIADALGAAHEQGLVHRDVKPQNILIRGDGTPALADFDLVHARDTTGGTRTGALGTVLYAAPEQNEDASTVDHRADVYGLGMTAVFCVHGKPLPNAAMYQRDAFLATLALDEVLGTVLRRAVAMRPRDRFQSMSSFRTQLAKARRAATRPGELPVPTAGRRWFIAGVVVLGLTFAGILGWPGGPTGDRDEPKASYYSEPTYDSFPNTRVLAEASVRDVKVFVDGEKQCSTPCNIEVPVDGLAHEVRFKKEGYIDVVLNWRPKFVGEPLPRIPDMKPL